jgi:hypothetical protein
MIGRWSTVDRGSEVHMKVGTGDESVQRRDFERVGVVLVLDEESFSGAIEDQGFRPFLREWMR